MDVKILRISDDYLEARLEGCSEALVNAIRRAVLEEVPTLAIHEVFVFENSSPMFDEALSNRLSLIPLRTPPGKYLPMDSQECLQGSNEKCFTSLSLDVSAGDAPITVYSKDLVCRDEEVYPAYGNIPITKLPPGGKLRLEAVVRLGRGRMHAKWQPASLATYSFTDSPDSFVFRLESTGSLPAIEVFRQALTILRDKFKTLLESVTLPEVEEKRGGEEDVDVSEEGDR